MKTSLGLLGRYAKEIAGVWGCFDRLVVTGTLTEIAHPEAMDAFLHREGFRAFDIGLFADPLRQRIGDNAVELARAAGVEIEYLSRSKGVRKEDLVAKVLARRGQHPGLVHVISVVESCTTFKPWRNPKKGQPGLRMQTGKCSTCYFYLIDPELGLMHVRVPTWLPCRLPFRQAAGPERSRRAQGPERSRGANLLPRASLAGRATGPGGDRLPDGG